MRAGIYKIVGKTADVSDEEVISNCSLQMRREGDDAWSEMNVCSPTFHSLRVGDRVRVEMFQMRASQEVSC